jgi:Icc protein
MHDPYKAQAQVITAAKPEVVRLVQITDCHIMATAHERLHDINTRHSFEAVSRAAVGNYTDLDLLLLTGDLSQDASAASYRYLATRFTELGLPTFWIPGNHDDDSIMREHLRGSCIFSARQVLVGHWQIVLLDSTIPGEALDSSSFSTTPCARIPNGMRSSACITRLSRRAASGSTTRACNSPDNWLPR